MSTTERVTELPDATGHFGPYGGRFVPETLVVALDELTREYERAQADPGFRAELDATLRDFPAGPRRSSRRGASASAAAAACS